MGILNKLKKIKDVAPTVLQVAKVTNIALTHGKEHPIFSQIGKGEQVFDLALQIADLLKKDKK